MAYLSDLDGNYSFKTTFSHGLSHIFSPSEKQV